MGRAGLVTRILVETAHWTRQPELTCWGVWKFSFMHSTCCAVASLQKASPRRAAIFYLGLVPPARGVLRGPFSAHIISGCQIPSTPPRVHGLAVMRKDSRRFARTKTKTHSECAPQLKCTCAIADMSSKTRVSNQSQDYHWTFYLTHQTLHWTNRCALESCGICGIGGGLSLLARKYKFPLFSRADWWIRLWGFYYVLILFKCVPESAGVLSATRVCGDTRPSVKQCFVFASTTHPNDPSIIPPS